MSKADQLKAAGISTSTANRYEQLASPSGQAAPAVEAAMGNYLATAALGMSTGHSGIGPQVGRTPSRLD